LRVALIRLCAAAFSMVALSAIALVAPGYGATASAGTASGGAGLGSGGAGLNAPATQSSAQHPVLAGSTARIIHGVAYAPALAPVQVQRAIWAGNQIRRKPYLYGGGHASFASAGYDCSGSVSYVLHAAGLLKTPFDSSDFMSWGHRGLGQWITVYTNPGHAFVEIAGIRFDTSSEGDAHPAPGSGPHWRPLLRNTSGFAARHPSGF
jgi:cell wall-associated NlpC family hydrolase